ncbi:hypothetical protein PFICI_13351 [Pestalotiopsis fici W106-1]|uniref:NmrA-like domain-containing protein n=1 Tax=Pestalotiopsis fici (strain W106-1 / CGMCC3.15140) TaxID=1229662 RepID=W3WP14_PESFW|nr:uncharacterized protein PFICI_13351 [Pestalotiopsis fici W106-1]ETS74867.1 hypothetical protein PFICI_13351 [Pestalotiopsis fici W106-1]
MSKRSNTAMMRIAIAGGGGFANILARQLSETAHAMIVLSRRPHPELETYGCQVITVDYSDLDNLQFTLRGVDLIISTISGPEQINLIDAARRAHVSCFVPSEFEGPLSRRPTDDPMERGSSTALEFLERCASSRSRPMRYTVFSCGLFYERFGPGGLSSLNMGASFGAHRPSGDMLDLTAGIAEIPVTNSHGNQVHVTMTSVYDVALFVASAIELGVQNWPREFRMRGAYVTTQRLVEISQEVTRTELEVFSRPYQQLHDWLRYHSDMQDDANARKMIHLIQVADGRYAFTDANLNELVDFRPLGLRDWLQSTWGRS